MYPLSLGDAIMHSCTVSLSKIETDVLFRKFEKPRASFQVQPLNDRHRDRGGVECVEVQSRSPQLEQPLAEPDSEVDGELEHLGLVVLDPLQGGHELLGHPTLAELNELSRQEEEVSITFVMRTNPP